ncbi:hypothetical protein I4U23_008635 [Adineta vaga]|nr:hypothetical protein I4U23_008635 [Adineta vaga]
MASSAAISTIVIEPEVAVRTESDGKDKFAQRFKPPNLKQSTQSSNRKQLPVQLVIEQPLRANDIKEHRLWALGSLILCFFLIGPIVAFYHTRRIRQMKEDDQLTRAKLWSDRVSNILIISNIIGIIIWVAFIFIIGVLFIFGLVY